MRRQRDIGAQGQISPDVLFSYVLSTQVPPSYTLHDLWEITPLWSYDRINERSTLNKQRFLYAHLFLNPLRAEGKTFFDTVTPANLWVALAKWLEQGGDWNENVEGMEKKEQELDGVVDGLVMALLELGVMGEIMAD